MCYETSNYRDPLFELLDESQKDKIREAVFKKLSEQLDKVDYASYTKKFVDKLICDMNESIKHYKIMSDDLNKFKDIILDLMKNEFNKVKVVYKE